MYFQHFFAMTSGIASGIGVETSYLIAIAVLACIFGAEVAGICVLIGKLLQARRARIREELEEERRNDPYGQETQTGSFAVALLAVGAVPMASQVALWVLSACALAGALVFLVLLIVFYVRGYALVTTPKKKESAAQAHEDASETTPNETSEASEPVLAATEESTSPTDTLADADEPITVVAAEEETFFDDDEEPFAAFDETPSDVEEDTAEEELVEEAVAETIEEAAEETVEAPVVSVAPAEPAAQTAVGGIPVYSSAYPTGQAPIVEKHITETYREIIRETTTNNNTQYSPATEEILKAIAELMKLGTQLRMEKEMVVENPVVSNESVPAFASVDEEEREVDEPEDEDVEDAAELDGEEDDYESELFTGNERIVGFDEETGCYIVAHYRKSLEAKLIQASPDVKKYYSDIRNALLSYENTKGRISWTIDTYTNDRTQIAKINVRNRTLDLYLALDPATLEDSVYHGRDVGDKKKYADTPFLFKVNSARKLTLALELVQRACEEQGLSPIDIEAVDYEAQYPFEPTEDLVRRGLIREYLREEKPAVTFELAPDHEPALPEEDESVIPANANFTWEFDNESPIEEETVPAPQEEPVEADEPVEVEPEAPSVTITRETVKTTERHYTEHSYGTTEQQFTYETETVEETCEADDEEATEELPIETVEDVALDADELTEEIYEDATDEETYAEEETYEDEEELYFDEDAYEDEALTDEEYEEDEEEAVEYEEEPVEEAPAPKPQTPPAAANTSIALLDVCLFDDYFENGAVVNLETLKQVGLAPESATVLKVYASGSVKGQYIVEANHFTLDAIRAIGENDGDSIMIR